MSPHFHPTFFNTRSPSSVDRLLSLAIKSVTEVTYCIHNTSSSPTIWSPTKLARSPMGLKLSLPTGPHSLHPTHLQSPPATQQTFTASFPTPLPNSTPHKFRLVNYILIINIYSLTKYNVI